MFEKFSKLNFGTKIQERSFARCLFGVNDRIDHGADGNPYIYIQLRTSVAQKEKKRTRKQRQRRTAKSTSSKNIYIYIYTMEYLYASFAFQHSACWKMIILKIFIYMI
jgi:hypothetical protein